MSATRRNLLILCLAYGLAVAIMVHQVVIDFAASGSEWRQGEWLINVESMPIRRGLMGSLLIRVSDATGIDLLTLTFALPMMLLALILASLVVFAAADGPGDRLFLVMMSPGFVLFWGADPESILRKEVLIYAAFLPLILLAGRGPTRGRALLAVSVGLFALAAAGHEMSAFFVPALVVAILACRPLDAASGLAIAAFLVLGVLTFAYALHYPKVPDIALVCDPLIARGISSTLCDGAIGWVARDIGFAHERLMVQLTNDRSWTVLLSYAAALLPFVAVLHGRPDAGRGLRAILLAGLPFLVLWFVALDWGRWVNAHVAVMVFLVLILRRRGKLPGFDAPMPRVLFLGTLAVCLGVGMRHVGGSIRAGLIEVAWRTFGAPGL
jgi:hypothetical protein